jgi:hypothetical protein
MLAVVSEPAAAAVPATSAVAAVVLVVLVVAAARRAPAVAAVVTVEFVGAVETMVVAVEEIPVDPRSRKSLPRLQWRPGYHLSRHCRHQ